MSAASSVQTPQNKATEWLNRLRVNAKIPFLIATAAMVALVVALVLWAKSPNYRVLYSSLSDQDGGEIIAQLSQMKVPWRFADGNGAIMVPEDKVHELRLRLAQQGLPKGGAVGFELLDQAKFGISQFSEQINYQRALEGELVRTIEVLGPVKHARVHLAMPKPSLFVRERKPPSASVTLTLQPGRAMDDGQINAIVHMVASAVAGLPPASVTIVDQNGNLLTRSDSGGHDLNDTQLKYTSEVEHRIQQRIESILSPILGAGNVHAQVSAQIDFNKKEQTEEQYHPNTDQKQTAIRSRQSSSDEQSGGAYPGGVPGALANEPAPANTGSIDTPVAQNSASNQKEVNSATTTSETTPSVNSKTPHKSSRAETTNYELNHTILHTKMNVGDIQRLSVAVVVNYHKVDNGKPQPLGNEQMKQIELLTREAMGYSQDRGDSLNVVNSPFSPPDTSTDVPFWKSASFVEQGFAAGRWLIALLAGWLVWRKMLRPQWLRWSEAVKVTSTQKQVPREEKDQAAEVSISASEQQQQRRVTQRLSAEIMSQRIRDMSDNDPRVVALVIRQWMSKNE